MRVASTDGVEIVVHHLGGDGPTVVLAHATGLHAMVWRPLADLLCDHFRLFAFDLRAHGDAGKPVNGNLAWTSFAADVLAAVDALGLDRPLGIGHSMGGASLVLAEVARPGTFRALYLFEPIVVPAGTLPGTGEGRNPMAEAAAKRRETFPSRDAAHENYASKRGLSSLAPAALRAYVDHGFEDRPDGTVGLKCRPADEAGTFRMANRSGAFERLAEVRCPVTVAAGAHTDLGALMFEAQAEQLPDGRLEVFDTLGHFGPLQDPPLVAESILRAFAPLT